MSKPRRDETSDGDLLLLGDNPPVAALIGYFNSGKVVCPYARSTGRIFTADTDLSLMTVGRSVSALQAGQVAVIYETAFSSLLNFEPARWWAYETHDYLRWLLSESATSGETRPVTVHFGGDEGRRPHLPVGTATFYAIGMGPQYPERHPRYAPHLCLVVVNEASIRAVTLPDRDPIRRAILERTGVVYSADEVWLPLEPEAAASPGKES